MEYFLWQKLFCTSYKVTITDNYVFFIHLSFLFFRSITRSYYRNAVGALLVYDITNRKSFQHVCAWADEAKLHVAPQKILFVLVGQKNDLEENRKVNLNHLQRLKNS